MNIDWIYNPWIDQRELVKFVDRHLALPYHSEKEDCKANYKYEGFFEELQLIKDSWNN